MKKNLPTLLISLLCIAIPVFAQENAAKKYALRGVIRDQNSSVIVGLPLKIDGIHSSLTDIDGEFYVSLADGDYVLTTDALSPDKFRAYIKITENGLNPNYLKFVIDASALICVESSVNSSPKIISSKLPKYPPAAKAIRAMGEVAVELKIAQTGDVISAKAVRGHPLLRASSVDAATNFKFDSSDAAADREIQLIFAFLGGQGGKKERKRYECPYRIMVFSELPTNEH